MRSQKTFTGLGHIQGTKFYCVRPLRIWDLSVRVASIILTNTIPLGKYSLNTIPLNQEDLRGLSDTKFKVTFPDNYQEGKYSLLQGSG